MSSFLEHHGLPLCFLVAGLLTIWLSLSFGRRASNQILFIVGAVLGGVISLGAIASLIEFRKTSTGEISAIFKREASQLYEETRSLKAITEDLEKKTVSLREVTERVSHLTTEIQDVVRSRAKSEGQFIQKLATLDIQLQTMKSRIGETASSHPVPDTSQKSAIAIAVNTSALEDGRRLRDKLVLKGFSAALRTIPLSERDRTFPAGTVNVVFENSDRPSADQVRLAIKEVGLDSRLKDFKPVARLTYEPVQVVMW